MMRRMLGAVLQVAGWTAVAARVALAHSGGGEMGSEMTRPMLLSFLLFITGFCMMVWDPEVFPGNRNRGSGVVTKE